MHLAIKTVIYLAIILFGLMVGAWFFPDPGGGWRLAANSAAGCAVLLCSGFSHQVHRRRQSSARTERAAQFHHRPLPPAAAGAARIPLHRYRRLDRPCRAARRLAFHRLVSRFVVDITAPIVAAYGEIHRYVGDELIATWKLADGIADAHCVRACFDALDRLTVLSPGYLREFGTPVHCRAGVHCGPVVTGEMGSVKKEIVFLGDTVNTTARIQEFCRANRRPCPCLSDTGRSS